MSKLDNFDNVIARKHLTYKKYKETLSNYTILNYGFI